MMAEIRELRPTVPRGPSPADIDSRRRFPIDVRKTSLPVMTEVAWQAIAAHNAPPQWFHVGGDPVRIVENTTDPIHTERLGLDGLGNVSARTAWWHKHTEKDGESEQFPLERVLRNMLADPDRHDRLPALRRIVRAPVFGKGGTLSIEPGYDHGSCNYYSQGDLRLDPIPEMPSIDDVEWAKALIFDDLLVDFPFVGPAERAHALSMMLNPFVRDMIDGPTPMYLIEAPAAGTGKGLLAQMLMYPALGTSPVLMPPSNNEEETRKRLTSTLMDIPEAVLIDNVARGLDSPSLAAALTTQMWHDRLLGRSETRGMPIRCTWIATGNNPNRSNEMSRRLIRIRLDARAERPEERTQFKHERIEQWAEVHRNELVRACLILVQRWVKLSGESGSARLGSFEAWSQLHSGILEAIGVEGFMSNKREAEQITRADDAAWEAFVDAWWEQYKAAEVATSELFPIAQETPEFPLGRSPNEQAQKTVLGKVLRQHRDRIFNGKRIEFAGTVSRLARFKLQEV